MKKNLLDGSLYQGVIYLLVLIAFAMAFVAPGIFPLLCIAFTERLLLAADGAERESGCLSNLRSVCRLE